MRKAFVGLSTPIGFDYLNKAKKAPADTFSSPNPVLDSPFGLLLMFDELIFLTRSLCPDNMRNLPYVSFLDESESFPNVTQAEIENVRTALPNGPRSTNRAAVSFQEALENAGAISGMNIDNHSHGLNIGPIHGAANADLANLAVDTYICSRLKDSNIELVTNTRLQQELESEAANQSLLTQLLIIDNIPNYLTPEGPYHPVIEEVRENPHLSAYRKWISEQRGFASLSEIREVKKSVESAIQDAQDKLFLKYCDPNRHYHSIGKAMLGDAIGLLCPVAGTATAILEAGAEVVNPSVMRWQGFVVGARQSARASFGNRS